MKKLLTVGLCMAFMSISLCACSQKTDSKKDKTDSTTMNREQKQSYAIGVNMGQNFKHDGLTPDMDKFIQGLNDGLEGKNIFTNEEMQGIFATLQEDLQKKQNDLVAAEKEKGKKFLEENKKNKSVITTESGLQYKVVKMGEGAKPTAESKVKVHYKGTLIDGTVFDSSYDRGEPITFGLNQVIKGWTEGVQLMPIGSKFIFYIPSDLGYGDRGAGADIPGGATLIFEIELLDIEKQ